LFDLSLKYLCLLLHVSPFAWAHVVTARAGNGTRLQGFYTTHAGNALFIARTFYKTTAVVKYYGAEGKRLIGQPLKEQGQSGLMAR